MQGLRLSTSYGNNQIAMESVTAVMKIKLEVCELEAIARTKVVWEKSWPQHILIAIFMPMDRTCCRRSIASKNAKADGSQDMSGCFPSLRALELM